MNIARLKIPTIFLAVVALVAGAGSGAVAATLITGADVKDGSLTGADIKEASVSASRLQELTIGSGRLKDGSVTAPKIANGSVTSSRIKDGTIGPSDLNPTAFGPTWSVVDRNVIGNGDSDLRSGPSFKLGNQLSTPPMGVGSLGIRTGSPDDKAAFGNQVDFSGDPFTSAAITTLGYSVFTTGENITAGNGAVNLPSIQFEINPNLAAHPADVFSTANFVPPASANLPGWNPIDAITSGEWFLTGATGDDVGCNQVTTCTFAQMMANLDDADALPPTIFTVQFSKGRDHPFSGAVDALKIDADVFDFEPFGVIHTTATP
jgi:hypothetical protein